MGGLCVNGDDVTRLNRKPDELLFGFLDHQMQIERDIRHAPHLAAEVGTEAQVVDKMTDKVTGLELDSSYKAESDRSTVAESKVYNYSNCEFTEDTVNTSLKNFTDKTGITFCIVVDNETTVFGGGNTVPEQNLPVTNASQNQSQNPPQANGQQVQQQQLKFLLHLWLQVVILQAK